jgi:hypothetical protein
MIEKLASGVLLGVLASSALAQSAFDTLPNADTLPEGVVQLSPTVPGMGEHWGNPADMPLGPIYCVHEGKIVCLEFMIAQEDFAAKAGADRRPLERRSMFSTIYHLRKVSGP